MSLSSDKPLQITSVHNMIECPFIHNPLVVTNLIPCINHLPYAYKIDTSDVRPINYFSVPKPIFLIRKCSKSVLIIFKLVNQYNTIDICKLGLS